MRKLTILYAVLFSFATLSCKDEKVNKSISTPEIHFTKEADLFLLKPAGDTIQTLDVEVADTDYERETGLMYRNSMEDDQGMLFVFENEKPRSFYMRNTKIPLDIIFIGANKSIVSIAKDAKPFNETSLPSNELAKYVLEVNAGLSERWNLEIGDKISFRHSSQQ